jgi:hypothetical protein
VSPVRETDSQGSDEGVQAGEHGGDGDPDAGPVQPPLQLRSGGTGSIGDIPTPEQVKSTFVHPTCILHGCEQQLLLRH